MRALRVIVVVAGIALVAAGCTGTGGGYGYGGGVVATQSPSAAPTAAPTTAPTTAASPSAASGGGGYTKGDYGYETGSPGAAASIAPGTVALSGYAFVPATLTVATGDGLTFTNGDATAHAIVIGENGVPASGQAPQQVEAGGSISITFPTAGTVKLSCTIHPSMNATVTVGP